MAQYRFQEQYIERLRQQRQSFRNERFDYDRDLYFYTAPIYRYNRRGCYYETNEYGAKMLRQAVNHGYEEGFRAGKADRDDRWRGNLQIADIDMLALLMATISSRTTSCHKSSISSLFAKDSENSAPNKLPATGAAHRTLRLIGFSGALQHLNGRAVGNRRYSQDRPTNNASAR
jgi:hypothetical protein